MVTQYDTHRLLNNLLRHVSLSKSVGYNQFGADFVCLQDFKNVGGERAT